jgi:hexosaminidase
MRSASSNDGERPAMNVSTHLRRWLPALIALSAGHWLSGGDNALVDQGSLIPLPERIERGAGRVALRPGAIIRVDAPGSAGDDAARLLAERINASSGLAVTVVDRQAPGAAKADIVLTVQDADAELGSEGYVLDIAAAGTVIRAQEGAGLFYGTQTLLQLLPPAIFSPTRVTKPVAWDMPVVHIVDRPRFRWRGLMLDVSRHFFSKGEVLNFIDLMAQQKLNRFHWHLVDDNGWRIEIMHYPKLTTQGAWRDGIGFGLDPRSATAYGGDGRYGGFYTQDDIREIVAYASRRHVTIIPEIEMPGHSAAATAAYPEFSSPVHPSILCPGRDETFDFLENVLTEVFALFPSTYIHIGGDEVPREGWKKCDRCQARIKAEGLKDERELQSYLTRRIEAFINSRQRILIGWDEILDGGIAPNAVVMSWRGIDGGIAAAKADHDVVMTPTSHCYFDFYQARQGEPRAIGGYLPLGTVYAYEPVPTALPAEKSRHVLGTAGNLWSEFVPNYQHVQYMTYPRACAIAEVAWTDRALRNWEDFQRRLPAQLRRLGYQGVNYRADPPPNLAQAISAASDGSGRIALAPLFPDQEIHVTLDGSEPTRAAPLYTQPLQLTRATQLKARYFHGDPPESCAVAALVLGSPPAIITTSMAPYADNTLDRAFDGREDTWFYKDQVLRKDDHITVTLLSPMHLSSITVLTGKPDRPKDIMPDGGVVEASFDGTAFEKVGEFAGGKADVALPPGQLRAVRIRAIAGNDPYWLVVREITVR